MNVYELKKKYYLNIHSLLKNIKKIKKRYQVMHWFCKQERNNIFFIKIGDEIEKAYSIIKKINIENEKDLKKLKKLRKVQHKL